MAVRVNPLAENINPIGAPEIDIDIDETPGSEILIFPVSGLPATPVIAGAVITGPLVTVVGAAAIVTASMPDPLNPVLLSLAATVTE